MYVWICKPCMALSRGNQDRALFLRFRTLSFQPTGRNWRQHLRYKLFGWTCFFSQIWFETSCFGCKDSLNFKYPCLKSPKGRQMIQNCVWTIRLLRLVKTSKGVSKSLFNPKGKFVVFSSVVYVNCSIKAWHMTGSLWKKNYWQACTWSNWETLIQHRALTFQWFFILRRQLFLLVSS